MPSDNNDAVLLLLGSGLLIATYFVAKKETKFVTDTLVTGMLSQILESAMTHRAKGVWSTGR